MSSLYYCDPPLHADPGYDPENSRGVWLAVSPETRSPGPGQYTSWESCRAATEGVRAAGGVFYRDPKAALPAWHTRCRLGLHAHPRDPEYVGISATPTTPTRGPIGTDQGTRSLDQAIASMGRPPNYRTLAAAADIRATPPGSPLRLSASPRPTPSTPTTPRRGGGMPSVRLDFSGAPKETEVAHAPGSPTTPVSLMPPDMHFAVRGCGVVYTSLSSSLQNYQRAAEKYGDASLIATTNYYKAAFFATGMDEWNADQLGELELCFQESAEAKKEEEAMLLKAVEAESEAQTQRKKARASAIRKAAIARRLAERADTKAAEWRDRLAEAQRWAQEAADEAVKANSLANEAELQVCIYDDDIDADLWEAVGRSTPPEERFDPGTENQPGDNL
ncbi:hypothetical protein B0H15DRAFT_950415 [Mycena belliarum]|uniref:Uncharacterized protein n=1 Tax=Mycena belliarum TaxID=1033014 RepID=A0AAD6U222_9AGAR|nr:hypothetical protein B0H15DRAFT_950415 [Mycena belliae]